MKKLALLRIPKILILFLLAIVFIQKNALAQVVVGRAPKRINIDKLIKNLDLKVQPAEVGSSYQIKQIHTGPNQNVVEYIIRVSGSLNIQGQELNEVSPLHPTFFKIKIDAASGNVGSTLLPPLPEDTEPVAARISQPNSILLTSSSVSSSLALSAPPPPPGGTTGPLLGSPTFSSTAPNDGVEIDGKWHQTIADTLGGVSNPWYFAPVKSTYATDTANGVIVSGDDAFVVGSYAQGALFSPSQGVGTGASKADAAFVARYKISTGQLATLPNGRHWVSQGYIGRTGASSATPTNALAGARAVAVSPLANDPAVYFGGYFKNGPNGNSNAVFVVGPHSNGANLALAGTVSGNIQDGFISKIRTSDIPNSPDGAVVWSYRLQASSGTTTTVNAMDVDEAGNLYVGGEFSGVIKCGSANRSGGPGIFVAKFSSTGTCSWMNTYNASGSSLNSLKVGKNASGPLIYITGRANGSINFGNATVQPSSPSVYLVRFNGSGAAEWAQTSDQFLTPRPQISSGAALKLDAAGNIYLAGIFRGAIPGGDGVYYAKFSFAGSPTIDISGSQNGFVAKLDPAGAALWMAQVKTAHQVFGEGIDLSGLSVDRLGNVLVGGSYQTSAVVDSTSLAASPGVSVSVPLLLQLNSSGSLRWMRHVGGFVSSTALSSVLAVESLSDFRSVVVGRVAGNYSIASQNVSTGGAGLDGFVSVLGSQITPTLSTLSLNDGFMRLSWNAADTGAYGLFFRDLSSGNLQPVATPPNEVGGIQSLDFDTNSAPQGLFQLRKN